MKFFKKLAIAAMTLSLALSTCALASCTDDEASSSTEVSVCYTFVVKNADGTPAQNVSVQLCAYKDDGELDACQNPVAVNAEGTCNYTYFTEPGRYHIQILDANYDSVDFDGVHDTPTDFGTVTLTLK